FYRKGPAITVGSPRVVFSSSERVARRVVADARIEHACGVVDVAPARRSAEETGNERVREQRFAECVSRDTFNAITVNYTDGRCGWIEREDGRDRIAGTTVHARETEEAIPQEHVEDATVVVGDRPQPSCFIAMPVSRYAADAAPHAVIGVCE